MPDGLKIAHKGLILIAIPVVFELLFVSVLIILLQEAEADLRKEILSKETIYTAGVLGRNVAEGATAIAAYTSTQSDYFKDKYEGNKKGIHRQLRKLKKLLQEGKKEEQLKRWKKLKAAVLRGELVLERVLKSTDARIEGNESRYSFTGVKALITTKKLITDIMLASQAILQEEKVLVDKHLKSGVMNRSRLQYLIIGFAVFNIFLAVILVNFFSKSITQRIESVIKNTHKVPKGEELNPPIGGSDEIAVLDQQFHSMVDELYKAQQMKQYLLSMVSHDLRSPLTSVQGILTMLGSGAFGELSDKAQKRVESAEQEIVRLISMTNDLLDVERLATGNLEMNMDECNSEKILETTLRSMSPLAEQHRVRLVSDPRNFNFEGDQDRLVQVMINLTSNAIKYSPRNGKVSLSCRIEENQARFTVKDQGRGIPEEFVEKIFEKFQQVEESDSTEKGGKGLGLAICKSIVEAHGGTVGVESFLGEGSTFWFEIPIKG